MTPKKSELKVQLNIHDSNEFFDYLYESKEEIESELGYPVEWINPENTKTSKIVIVKKTDVTDESNWEECIDWQLTKASEFYEVFADRVRNF